MNKTNDKNQIATIRNSAKKCVKPPLGLTPKWVIQEARYFDVCGAISRYYNAGLKIPIEWIEEYNELVEWFSQRSLTPNNR